MVNNFSLAPSHMIAESYAASCCTLCVALQLQNTQSAVYLTFIEHQQLRNYTSNDDDDNNNNILHVD